LSIDALRDHVRQALSRASRALAQLAALDAVLDQMLGGREQKLLSTVPAFLERRFEQLCQRSQSGPEAAQSPGDGLDVFRQEFQQALLAELDVRLEPVKGMIEALSNEVKKYQ
jgi:hypothetical protein